MARGLEVGAEVGNGSGGSQIGGSCTEEALGEYVALFERKGLAANISG